MSASHAELPTASSLPVLPDHVRPLRHQVAGHIYDKKKAKLGFLECEDGSILKPLQSGRRGESELSLYRRVFDPACTSPALSQLRPLVARFLGTVTLPEHKDVTYVNLEDLTAGFVRPHVADVKLGGRTYDPLAGPEKVAREEAKYPPAKTLGFQLRGMRVYDETSHSFTTYSKEYLRSFNEDTIEKAFMHFFTVNGHVKVSAVQACLNQLKPIHEWFQHQKELSFYASSILVVYEGDPDPAVKVPLNGPHSHSDSTPQETPDSGTETQTDTKCGAQPGSPCNVPSSSQGEATHKCRANVRMIDFAHVFSVDHVDENNLLGVRTLVNLFERLLDK